MRITVIGTGNGAFAAAADLSDRGHEITLYASEAHMRGLVPIMETRTIRCQGVGPVGDVRIHNVTCDPAEAFAAPDLIMPVVPAFAHEEIAEDIAPYIKDGMKIVLAPGSTGGSLVFAKIFGEKSSAEDIRIAEIHTLPYTARKVGGDGVRIPLMLKMMFFAAFPAKYNQEMYDIVSGLYPNIRLVGDVLETSLNNGNAVSHPAPVVLNAGKIEHYGKHYHYMEGITPSVARVIQDIDDERKAICRAYGYDEIDIKTRLFEMGYCPDADTVYESYQGSKDVFLPIEGPNSLNDRYLTEDTPYSLVAMSEFAKAVGVATPYMDSIITLAGGLMDVDYRVSGRTLDKMGLNGMTKAEIEEYIHNGK